MNRPARLTGARRLQEVLDPGLALSLLPRQVVSITVIINVIIIVIITVIINVIIIVIITVIINVIICFLYDIVIIINNPITSLPSDLWG